MPTISETREITIPYRDKELVVEEYRNFGWTVTNTLILNRFGGPLEPDEHPSEKTLKEVCYVRLSFYRCIDDAHLKELMNLQSKCSKLKFYDEGIGGGPVTGCVFLSIASTSSIVGGIVSPYQWLTILGIINGIGLGGFITLIMINAFKDRHKKIEHNKKVREERNAIFREAEKLLENKVNNEK